MPDLNSGEAVECEFQDNYGEWCRFDSPKHRDSTIADGRWPIRYLYAEPQPASVADGWRDIESAPKDGTEMDVWCKSALDGDDGGYRTPNAWWCRSDMKWRRYGDERIAWAHSPTHWQPLPPPPADRGAN